MSQLAISAFKFYACFVLSTTSMPALSSEIHCPGSVVSVSFHVAKRHAMILPVSASHAGPYNFPMDIETEITMVDPAMANEVR